MWRNSFVNIFNIFGDALFYCFSLNILLLTMLLELSQFISLCWALNQEVLAVHNQQENTGMCLFKNADTSYQEVRHSKVLNDCIHWNITVWFITAVWYDELSNDLETRAVVLNKKHCNLINGNFLCLRSQHFYLWKQERKVFRRCQHLYSEKSGNWNYFPFVNLQQEKRIR